MTAAPIPLAERVCPRCSHEFEGDPPRCLNCDANGGAPYRLPVRHEPVSHVEAHERCESPIEEQFLEAFSALCIVEAGNWRRKDEGDTIEIVPQFQIGEYRVDFLISQGKTKLIVECDGHDYHNITKEQALNDRKRDRWLLANGYPVFRFTGSELHANADRCAAHAFRYVDDRALPHVVDDGQIIVNPYKRLKQT